MTAPRGAGAHRGRRKPKRLTTAAARERARASTVTRRPQARRPDGRGAPAHSVPGRRARRIRHVRLVLSDTLLTGAGGHDRAGLAAAIQGLGADLAVSVDADRLMISRQRARVRTAAHARTGRHRPDRAHVRPRRGRDRARPARREVAHRPLARRRRSPPSASACGCGASTRTRSTCRSRTPSPRRHRAQVRAPAPRPSAARTAPMLVIVGDVSPSARARPGRGGAVGVDRRAASASRVPPLPTPPAGPLLVVDRPGSVQSSLRMGTSAVATGRRALSRAAAGESHLRWLLLLALDGEHPRGQGLHVRPAQPHRPQQLGSSLMFDVEVASEVTAPALLETRYELGRIASLPVTDGEVDAVRQYAIGDAGDVDCDAGRRWRPRSRRCPRSGWGWTGSGTHAPRLAEADRRRSVSCGRASSSRPRGLTSVIVGDAATIAEPLAALGPME